MRFIDLFAGLGGFHIGLSKLGHKCVYACEKNETLAALYKENFNIDAYGDIRKINLKDIPRHDILCAGFPCQPFSKAGKQLGLGDEENGEYFSYITRILQHHKPKYLILENVPNISEHDSKKTWKIISERLNKLDYDILPGKLSPHQFGIPQFRERLFIVGARGTLGSFEFPAPLSNQRLDIRTVLQKKTKFAKKLDNKLIKCLNLWQELLTSIPKDYQFPSFPVWSMEFGATYPYEHKPPISLSSNELGKYRGIFGKQLKGLKKCEQIALLPAYAKSTKKFPKWKQKFIKQNRNFYTKNKKSLKPFLRDLMELQPTWQKFEWNCLDEPRKIYNHLIQIRTSGIRVKRTNYAPTIVLSSTQVPIVGWEKRYMTLKELAKLQSLGSIALPEEPNVARKAIGNAVNAELVRLIGSNLLK